MTRKLYNIQQNGTPIASLLTSVGILAHFNHASLKAWMKDAQVGQWHGVLHPLLTDLQVKRIQ